MNPEQQNQNPGAPTPPPTPVAPPPNPAPTPTPPPAGPPPPRPRQPEMPAEPKYSTGQMSYDPNYLDSIAPQAPAPSFFSGSFGKIFFVMIGLFVLAVSLIVAFSGRDNTKDLQQMVVRLENMEKVVDSVHDDFKSNNLKTINVQLDTWLANNRREGQELLDLGGVQRTDFSKEMIRSEEAYASELEAKFEDARLSARLHRVYKTTIVIEIDKIINVFKKMQKNPSPQIREYAESAVKNVEPIQKQFDEFEDDGN